MSENLAYNKQRSEDRVNDPRLPVNQDLDIAAMLEAGGNIDLDLTLTRKFCRTLGPRGATLADHACAPSNGFQAAVYDSIGPATDVHDRQ